MTNQYVEVVSTLVLYVHAGESCVRVSFGIGKYLAVPVQLGTLFIEKFVKEIVLPKREIFSYNLQAIPILTVQMVSINNGTRTRAADVVDGSVLTVETEEQEYLLHVANLRHSRQCPKYPFQSK